MDKATERLKEIIWRQVSKIFIIQHHLEVTEQELIELQKFNEKWAAAKYENKREIDIKIEKKFHIQWIENWKINQKLYELYGGKVAITKFGYYPYEAVQSLFTEYNSQGKFSILDISLRENFWATLMKKPKYIASPEQIDFTPYWRMAEKK